MIGGFRLAALLLFGSQTLASAAEPASGWVEFEMTGQGIRLPAKLNGQEVSAILDNGASSTVVDQSFAAAHGLVPVIEKVAVPGAGSGSAVAGRIPNIELQVGDTTFPDLTLFSVDLSPIAKATGHLVPVMIGAEAFLQKVVDIDFPHHRLAFRDPAGFSAPAGATALPLEHRSPAFLTSLSVEGHEPIRTNLDLGYAGALELNPDYAQAEKLLDGRRTSERLFSSIGGIEKEKVAILRMVTLGPADLHDVPTDLPPTRPAAMRQPDISGQIGIGLLRRYRVIFDVPHDRLFLIPDPSSIAQPFVKDRLGMSALPEGAGLTVMLVAPNSPAAQVGLRAGDSIVTIDGQSTKGWGPEQRWAMTARAAGTHLTLTLEDGRTLIATLADFY